MSALCIGCYADPDMQPDCSMCRGTGLSGWIPFADRPWDEVAPNLWLGGYDFQPLGSSRVSYTTEMLVQARFDVVISFYTPYGVDLSRVEHHALRIPDGSLGSGELLRVRELAELAHRRAQEGKKVLIHCQAGLNRSSLCMAYALQHQGWRMQDAINHFRKIRSPFCLVNKAFVDYLLASEEASLVQRFANALDRARRVKEAELELDLLGHTLIGREAIASVKLDGETQVIENVQY